MDEEDQVIDYCKRDDDSLINNLYQNKNYMLLQIACAISVIHTSKKCLLTLINLNKNYKNIIIGDVIKEKSYNTFDYLISSGIIDDSESWLYICLFKGFRCSPEHYLFYEYLHKHFNFIFTDKHLKKAIFHNSYEMIYFMSKNGLKIKKEYIYYLRFNLGDNEHEMEVNTDADQRYLHFINLFKDEKFDKTFLLKFLEENYNIFLYLISNDLIINMYDHDILHKFSDMFRIYNRNLEDHYYQHEEEWNRYLIYLDPEMFCLSDSLKQLRKDYHSSLSIIDNFLIKDVINIIKEYI